MNKKKKKMKKVKNEKRKSTIYKIEKMTHKL